MENEMDAELRFHMEAYAEDLARGGVAHEEAMRRARLEFGGIERAKEFVPTPYAYSRLICSNSSTLALLFNRVSSRAHEPETRSTVYGFQLGGGPN
jgi:hypothetical protein